MDKQEPSNSVLLNSPRSTVVVLSEMNRSNSNIGGSSLMAQASESTSSTSSQASSTTSSSAQHQGGNPTVLFPWKLHEMLQNSIRDDKESVVSWLPDGKAFKVHNIPEFVKNILPLYFKQTKYKSFQRQLNLWGFERLTTGALKGAYFHHHFVRDHPDWCQHLTRQRAKKAGTSEEVSSTSNSSSSKKKTVGNPKPKGSRSGTAKRPSAKGASMGFMPRQVSESSLESFGELLREFDTAATTTAPSLQDPSSLDLAEFEGFTFHLLEQERYEELNLEFKFKEQIPNYPEQVQDEDDSVHSLLQELEQGTFGTPKTSFDGGVTPSTAFSSVSSQGLCAM